MPLDLEKLGNIFGQDTIKKIYEDGASPAVQEMGKALADFAKTFRLFTAPIQLLASYQDRLSHHLEKVRNSVKEENQIEAPASISGPIIEQLKYLEETNYLTTLYLNLLCRSIDKERIQEAHPAFYHLINQLSSDEAIILYYAKRKTVEVKSTHQILAIQQNTATFSSGEMSFDPELNEKITFLNHINLYGNHLRALNLIEWKMTGQNEVLDTAGKQSGTVVHSEITLSDFGNLFVQACISDDANPI